MSITGIESILKVFIGRFSSSALSDWGRGVVMFSPEPSYAAHSIYFFFSVSIYFFKNKLISLKKLYIFLMILVFMTFTNQSVTIGGIIMINLTLYVLFARKFKLLIIIPLILSFIVLFFPDLRLVRIILSFLLSIFNEGSIDQLYVLLVSLGSTRELSVIISYLSLFNDNFFGYGLGSWSYLFLEKMVQFGFDPSAVERFQRLGLINLKPYSYVALVIFDLGLIGLITFSFLYRKIFKLFFKLDPLSMSIAVTSLFMIFFHSLTSLPLYWICFAFSLNFKKQQNN